MNKKILLGIVVIALSVTAFVILATTSAQAKKVNQAKAKIEWSQPRLRARVKKGDVIQTTLVFTPTSALANAEFRATAGLNDTVTFTPSNFANLSAGAPQQVTVTFTAPTEGKRKRFNGILALIDDNYLYAKPLKLHFSIGK